MNKDLQLNLQRMHPRQSQFRCSIRLLCLLLGGGKKEGVLVVEGCTYHLRRRRGDSSGVEPSGRAMMGEPHVIFNSHPFKWNI